MWQDIVDQDAGAASTNILSVAASNVDLEAAEELAQATLFASVRAQLAADVKAAADFNAAKQKTESREHVLHVLHMKSQNEAGSKRLSQIYLPAPVRIPA